MTVSEQHVRLDRVTRGNRDARWELRLQPNDLAVAQVAACVVDAPPVPRTLRRSGVSYGMLGVREVARRRKGTQFTALLHHATVPQLRDSFYALKRDAAPGVDGVTWQEYDTDLDRRLEISTANCPGVTSASYVDGQPNRPGRPCRGNSFACPAMTSGQRESGQRITRGNIAFGWPPHRWQTTL